MTSTRNAALTVIVLTAVALSTALAAPLSASASGAISVFCPPQITKVGTTVNHELLDGEEGSGFKLSITSGALPDGLRVISSVADTPVIMGTPTKVGSFPLHLHFADNVGHVADKNCTMDIVPTTSIVSRLDGEDRYLVAAAVAEKVATGGKAPLVYVASGENFADALSASAIAAQHNAPLFLSPSADMIDPVFNHIAAMAPADIVVVGGEAALAPAVTDRLKMIPSKPTVTRIGGADRFAVSRALISDPKFGAKPSTSIAVATGLNFPDALSASPVAGKLQMPVLLVNGGATSLSADEKALLTSRSLTSATLYGGADVLSDGIATDLKTVATTVTRVDGDDRFIVSANTVAANYTGPTDTVYLATGANFPDALAGGVLAGVTKSPILLTRKSCMATEVAAQVRALAPKHIVLLGGPAVLDANLENLPTCS